MKTVNTEDADGFNTNAVIQEILAFPGRYEALVGHLDKYTLARLKNKVGEALAANPRDWRAAELGALYAAIERDQGR